VRGRIHWLPNMKERRCSITLLIPCVTKHVLKTSCAFLEVPNGMFCILEVLHVIFYIFGRNSQDVRNPRRNFQNVHNPTRTSQIHTFSRGSSKNAQNPTWNFQKSAKSQEKILCIFRRSSWDFVHYLKSIM
jgi:hypothetical protein